MSSFVRQFYNCQKQKVKNILETLYTAIRYHRPCFMLCALTSKYKATKSKLVWVPFKDFEQYIPIKLVGSSVVAVGSQSGVVGFSIHAAK